MAQTLKFGNGNFATKAGSTLCYDDQNGNFKPIPMDFTRASTATRVNKQGLIEVVKSNVPRIDYTDTSDGVLLLEKAATNLFPYSEDFSQSNWLKTNSTITSGFVSPKGDNNAYEFNMISSTANLYENIGVSAQTDYTLSFYAKKGTATDVSYKVYDTSNLSDIISETSYYSQLSTDWVRIEISFTTPLGCSQINSFLVRSSTNFGTVLIYGAQLEQNSSASSYIPSQGSASTRVAETASGAGNSEVFNDSEGVLFANIAANSDTVTTYNSIGLGSGLLTNRIGLGFEASSNIYVYKRDASNSWLPSITMNIKLYNKVALSYNTNDNHFWLNGFKMASNTTVGDMSQPTSLGFEASYAGEQFYGKTKELAYYDTILTDLELETLTSYRSWESMVNELNLNIIYNG